jgi:hypothetical protein
LIKIAANEDGGAHVDPMLNEIYSDLAKENSLSWLARKNGRPLKMENPHHASLRQIAYETLVSLKPMVKRV